MNPNIPGLTDSRIECFLSNGELFFLQNGATIKIDELHSTAISAIKSHLIANPTKVELMNRQGIIDERSQMVQLMSCLCGGLDHSPDIDDEGLHADYHPCPYRVDGSCPFEMSLCESPKINGYSISKREVEILQMLAIGLQDKEISAKLGTSVNTVKTQLQRLREKTGLQNRAELIAASFKLGLINPSEI